MLMRSGTILLVILLMVSALSASSAQIQRASSSSAKPATLLQHNNSPIITFRLLFVTGSAFDPPGKEGLASLTAAMLAQGGTRSNSYDQILQALYPIASSVGWQVDKEMTVISG